MMTDDGRSPLKALLGAALLIALALGLATTDFLNADTESRIMMVVFGAMLVVSGNSIPKALRPRSAMRCDSTREQSIRRFMGWFFVLTGIAWIAVWLTLPVDYASVVTLLTAGACLLLILMCFGIRRRVTSAGPE